MTIKAYLVDDSAVMRQTLQHLLQGRDDIELIGAAPNPLLAAPALRKNRPDVLLLDIEMPGMDGLTFLRQLMETDPIPTVICSTLTSDGSRAALEALSAGAVAVIDKPRLGLRQFLEDSRRELVQALKTAARARPRPSTTAGGSAARPSTGASPGTAALAATGAATGAAAGPARTPVAGLHALAMNKPVLIGSSTGGTQAIESVLLKLPGDAPGIAITQHMPERFTAMFAQRLDGLCAMRVREARDGDRLERGMVLIAPGVRHMQLKKHGGQYHVGIGEGPPVNRHKPSVDVLFRSAAECAGRDALGIILTGMGDDGARGLKAMHARGARTLAQDEASCVVFGMPKEAIALGAVDEVMPLAQVACAILAFDARG